MTACKNPENTTTQAVSASFQPKIIFPVALGNPNFQPRLFIEFNIICQYRYIEKNLGFIWKYRKKLGFQDGNEGYVIGSYSSLGFRALRKDVDWTLAETAEHLSGH